METDASYPVDTPGDRRTDPLAFAGHAAFAVADDAVAAGKTAPAALAPANASRPPGRPAGHATGRCRLQRTTRCAHIGVARRSRCCSIGDVLLASRAYADLALRTRDAKVFERSVEIAACARRYDVALDMARRWLGAPSPIPKRAQQLLVGAMIQSNQLDDLAPYLVRMLELDRAELPANLLGLNRMFVRNPDRLGVFRLVEKVCRPFFGDPEAHYATAVAEVAGLAERALAETWRRSNCGRAGKWSPCSGRNCWRGHPQAEAVAFYRFRRTLPAGARRRTRAGAHLARRKALRRGSPLLRHAGR